MMVIKVKKIFILFSLFIYMVLPAWVFSENIILMGDNGLEVSVSIDIIIFYICVIILLIFPKLRVITMDEEGCTVAWLWLKKFHKWKELEIVREDRFGSGRMWYQGIVFSRHAFRKNGKEYTSNKIFTSFNFLNCFYVCYNPKKGTEPVYGVDRQELLTQMEAWGVKVEKGKTLQEMIRAEERRAKFKKLKEEEKRIREDCKKKRNNSE